MPKIGQTTKTITSAAVGGALTPYWQTTDGRACRLYLGNVTEVLARLPARLVQTCVTSPPYWGLRDYGTGTWEGGDPNCDHLMPYGGGIGDNSPLQQRRAKGRGAG